MLAAKIDKLLLPVAVGQDDINTTASSCAIRQHRNERFLVALVLLTRLRDTDQFVAVWESRAYHHCHHCCYLSAYCVELLQDTAADAAANHQSSQQALLAVFTRLVAQLTDRMPSDQLAKTIQELSEALLVCMGQRTVQRIPLSAADVEIASSMNVWFEIADETVVDTALTALWERYQSVLEPAIVGDKFSVESSETISAQDTMIKTLTTLLDDRLNPESANEEDLWKSWEIEAVALFLEQGMRVAQDKVPAFWLPALQWWLQTNKSTSNGKRPLKETAPAPPFVNRDSARCSWAQILLLCTRSMALVSSFQDQLAKDVSFAVSLQRLVLTCVVSVQDSDRLRSIAWSTCATLIEYCDWEWLLVTSQENAKPSTLGRAASLCALLRLAVGEWKIQLGLLVSTEAHAPSEERVLLVQACAQVIVHAVFFVVEMADRMDAADSATPLPLSADALVHIRKSLEEALNLSVQYLGLTERRLASVDGPAVRVLAVLLSEFDVFEKHVTTKELEDGNEILQALRVALDIHQVECQEDLLPCLAAVLTSSEGDESKVALLEEYELLDEPLVGFLEAFWNQAASLSSTQSACQVIELWSAAARIADVSRLLQCIVGWIKRNLEQSSPPSDELKTALSTAVACYVTLQGDERPGEPDAMVLQRALEFCAQS
jgi:hypothetical protein